MTQKAKLPTKLSCLLLAGLMLLTACATETERPTREHLELAPVSFDDLPGWNNDTTLAAITALDHSCTVILNKPDDANFGSFGHARDWKSACYSLMQNHPADEASARAFITANFQPYSVTAGGNANGLFTGYYEAELRGSPTQQGPFQVPLYTKPDDLITVDLSLFRTEWKGHNIVGKVEKSAKGNRLVPYDDRTAIAQGSLTNRAQPLVWVDDKVDAFFLEIQGSGRVHMMDGSVIRVGYDGTNGRAFVPIGRTLADSGDIPRPVTMPSVRAWLAAHPDRAQAFMDQNRSYVFFRRVDTSITDNDGPVGAENVPLTAQRSLAVDPAYIPLGTPLWLDTTDGTGHTLQRLMIAQDTGGAIKGIVRGDFFWGYGKEAETQAGAMQSRGRYFALLPRSVTPHVGT